MYTIPFYELTNVIAYADDINSTYHALAFELLKINAENRKNYVFDGIYLNEFLIHELEKLLSQHLEAGHLTQDLFFKRSTIEKTYLKLKETNTDQEIINFKQNWLVAFYNTYKANL
jgi:hypothetical protein